MAESDFRPYGSVYLITNTANKKVYVGQTTMTLHARWRAHATSRSMKVGLAIQQYGRAAFVMELLGTAETQNALDSLESEHIARLNSQDPANGYNSTSGGRGATIKKSRESIERGASQIRGRKMTPEQVEKMAASKRGRNPTEAEWAHLNRMKAMRTGVKHSDESRKKMSEALIGYKRPPATDETKARLAASARKQWAEGRGHSPKKILI
jgi:group I intron endonuclease